MSVRSVHKLACEGDRWDMPELLPGNPHVSPEKVAMLNRRELTVCDRDVLNRQNLNGNQMLNVVEDWRLVTCQRCLKIGGRL